MIRYGFIAVYRNNQTGREIERGIYISGELVDKPGQEYVAAAYAAYKNREENETLIGIRVWDIKGIQVVHGFLGCL